MVRPAARVRRWERSGRGERDRGPGMHRRAGTALAVEDNGRRRAGVGRTVGLVGAEHPLEGTQRTTMMI